MSPLVGDWVKILDGLFPPALAEEWDNVGLQVGDPSWPADRALVALDPTAEVVHEAADLGCGLLVTHHPLLFRPLARLDTSEPAGAVVAEAFSARVAVVACHTNADVARPGVTDALAETLDLRVTGVLRPGRANPDVKLVTFVPAEATGKVLEAVVMAGAGVIGEYTHCSFRVRGTGTFLPSERANPTVGDRGALNEVEEDRLEVVLPHDRLAGAITSLLAAHPYEEVAYDVYPLAGTGGPGPGRLAELDRAVAVAELAERCRARLGAGVRTAGNLDRPVRNLALCGGAGAFLIPDAVQAGADVLVTGDVKHHQALDAVAAGMSVIDPGHHGTEWPFVATLAEVLGSAVPGSQVTVAETPTDPFAPS
jgi:dinuclear metal center YbgI/SA1388 family protein